MDMKQLSEYIKEHGPAHYKNLVIENASKLIEKAGHLVILTGAGISTESGIPDFRSQGGLWDGKDPLEISSEKALYEDTESFVEFFSKRIDDIGNHTWNSGHGVIADWQKEKKVTVITQNIDGYHQAAGTKDVIELHGHLRYLECDVCGTRYDHSKYTQFKDTECEVDYVDFSQQEGNCDGRVRPPVVLFGEMLPPLAWHQALMAIQTADVVLVLGTSLQVFPFNDLINEAMTGTAAAKLIIITQSETPFDRLASVRINEPIGETLKAINDKINN
jgi:NAD-dependent deacetylase